MAEIAKHLAFKMKIIAKLCNQRCHMFIRIFDVPEKVQMQWNDDRIILFPDIRGLRFGYVARNDKFVLQFDQEKIKRMRLISFKYYDIARYHGHLDINFSFLKGMKTLKQIYFYTGDNYYLRDEHYTDDILDTLDLEYYDHIVENMTESFMFYDIKEQLPKHRNLKSYNYLDDWHGFDDQQILLKSIQYLYYSNSMKVIPDCNLHTLRYELDDSTSLPQLKVAHNYQYLSRYKLHKLHLDICVDGNVDYTFMKNMKLYELRIGLYRTCNLPPIEYLKGIKILYIKGFGGYYGYGYSDADLKKLDPDTIVKQSFLNC